MEELIGRSSCSVLAGPNCLPLFNCSISLSTTLTGSLSHFSLSDFCQPPILFPFSAFSLFALCLFPFLVSPPLALSSHLLLLSNLLLVLGSMTCQWRGDCPCPRLIRQLIIQHFTQGGRSAKRQPHMQKYSAAETLSDTCIYQQDITTQFPAQCVNKR